MAQRKQLTWSELRVGLFVLAGLFILMVGIFYVTGAGFLGPKYRLTTYLPEVAGLKTGAPVDLDGVEIGNVQSISLTPNPPDREHSITLVLRVDRKYQNQIRSDSMARLVTQGLLGDRYVTISRGLTGSVVPPNGTIPGVEAGVYAVGRWSGFYASGALAYGRYHVDSTRDVSVLGLSTIANSSFDEGVLTGRVETRLELQ